MGLRIGFVSTRLAGTDGVSLEASKWAEVLEKSGHTCYWFAGELDRAESRCFLVPEAHFQHPRNLHVNAGIMGRKKRTPQPDHPGRSRLESPSQGGHPPVHRSL